jgi:hypothetical protein
MTLRAFRRGGVTMARPWEADPQAKFSRRLGKSALELGETNDREGCPDIWQLSNGDVAIIGRDLTENYLDDLPGDVSVVADERLVIIPGSMLRAAKKDIPDE